MLKKGNPIKIQRAPAGEPLVWLTGMGLALGLLMIFFLLGLILVKGLEVFWPKDILVIELAGGSPARIQNSDFIAGTLIKKQERLYRTVTNDDGPQDMEEWQLFVGNKDLFGFGFRYIDVSDIRSLEMPPDILRIERLEYGDAIAFPVALKLKDGTMIEFNQPGFNARLKALVKEAGKRWKKIRHIEKNKIGAINRELESLRIMERRLMPEAGTGQDKKLEKIRKRGEELQQGYQLSAAEARELRNRQNEDSLVYHTVTGREKELPAGMIVHFYYPNRINVFQKLGLFFHKIGVFLTHEPREANTEGGVFPAIFGTFVMTVIMSMAVMPFGVLAAIYLREYAKQGFFVRCVRIAVNNLAGVPSIVFGVFGLGFFVYFVGGTIDNLFFRDNLPTPTFGTGGILWASLTLALLTVPVVIVASEEALAAVPRGMREGALACGASKWQTIKNIVLPAAAPGILTGLILAMARGASEVAPLMLVGVVKLAPSLPVDGVFPFIHLERKFMHLGFHIYDLGFQSPDSEAAKPMVFATTLLLIGLVVVLNIGAIMIRQRLRKKYAMGAF